MSINRYDFGVRSDLTFDEMYLRMGNLCLQYPQTYNTKNLTFALNALHEPGTNDYKVICYIVENGKKAFDCETRSYSVSEVNKFIEDVADGTPMIYGELYDTDD